MSDKLAKAREEAAKKLEERRRKQAEEIMSGNTFRKSPNKTSIHNVPPKEEKPVEIRKQKNKRISTPTRKVSQPKKMAKQRNSTPTKSSLTRSSSTRSSSRGSFSKRMETSSSDDDDDDEIGLEEEEEEEEVEKEVEKKVEEEAIIEKVKNKKSQKVKQKTPPVTESMVSTVTPPPSLIMGLAQLTSTTDISQNMKTCFDAIKTAAEQNIQFLFFPEGFYYMGNATSSSKLSDLKPFGLKLDSPFITQICEYAKQYSMWVSLGGFPEILDNRNICNTHIVINLQGYIVSIYRQVHTLPSTCYTPGNNMVALGIDDIKFALSIGNDIYYPNFYRQLRIKGYADFLIIPSSLSDDLGEDQWMTLLKTRAIENQCIVVAANQVGRNYKGFKSYGHSVIVSPDGKLLNAPNTVQGVVVVKVDLSSIEREREYNMIQYERKDVYNGIISPSC